MSPLEKKDRRLGEGKRFSKEITFIDLPKITPSPFTLLIRANGSSLIPPHVTESGIWERRMWNPESLALESGVQLKESGIPLVIGSENPSSTDKDWNRH